MKGILSPQSKEFVQKIFGSLLNIEKSKIIYSACVRESTMNSSRLNVIIKNEFTPSMGIDWEAFCFLRCVSNTFITTGEIIRKEENTTSMTKAEFFDRPDWKNLYLSTGAKKRIFILSRKMDKASISSLSIFKEQNNLAKIITMNKHDSDLFQSDESFLKFLKNQDISFSPPVKDLLEAISYIEKTYSQQKILIETGIQTSNSLFQITNIVNQPLDMILLGVYRGDIDSQFIGTEHPSFDRLNNQFHLAHISQQYSVHKGNIQFYTYLNKHKFST